MVAAAIAPPVELDERVLSFGRAAIIGYLDSYVSANHEIPIGIVSELANALRIVESGHVHPLFLPVEYGREGRPSRELLENQEIRTAVRYRMAVELKNIADRAPIKSIHEAFGGEAVLSRRTVQTWMKEFNDQVKPLPAMPSDLAKSYLVLAGILYQRQFTRTARAKR